MSKDFIKVLITIIMIFSICFSFAISSFAGNDGEIFFYDGTNIIQLTDNDFDDVGPRINDSGEVVWYSTDLDGGSGGGGVGGGFDFGPIKPCFISSAIYGFRMSEEILTLAFLFVSILIVFHKIRAKIKN